jgi:hypothetical protein
MDLSCVDAGAGAKPQPHGLDDEGGLLFCISISFSTLSRLNWLEQGFVEDPS